MRTTAAPQRISAYQLEKVLAARDEAARNARDYFSDLGYTDAGVDSVCEFAYLRISTRQGGKATQARVASQVEKLRWHTVTEKFLGEGFVGEYKIAA